MSYIPVHVKTCWSLLDSTVLIDKLASKADEYKIPAVCLTDHMNLKGVVTFAKEMNDNGIQPIIGCEIDIWDNQKEKVYKLTLLAKNKAGYKNLVKIVSNANHGNIIKKHGQPLVYWNNLSSNRLGLIALIGELNSELSHNMFTNWEMAYKANDLEMCRSLLDTEYDAKCKIVLEKYKGLFEDNLYIFADYSTLPILTLIMENNKRLAKEYLDNRYIPSNNVHYLTEEERDVHKIILKARVEADKAKVEKLEDYEDYRIFHTDKSNCHLLPSLGEDNKLTLILLEKIEKYTIQEKPLLPKFKLTGEHVIDDPDQILYELCKKGFMETGLARDLKQDANLKQIYGDRIRKELKIIKEAGVSSYFLVVNDLVQYAKKEGVPVDARGSATGCMASYLLGMSSVDPVRPDPVLGYAKERELSFERFYNAGRNTKDNVSLPDIDIDLPPNFREKVIQYAKKKYGDECVGHIITHSRFKGKGAIKEVFKLMDIPFEVANEVTKLMVDEAKISDELAEIQLDNPDYGIIQWNLDNIPSLTEHYTNYKSAFDIAIMLEKIPKNASVHAAGIIVADQPLSNLFPMVYSEKLDDMVVSIEGKEVEYIGAVKMDILGVAMLEKVYKIQEMINKNLLEVCVGM